MSTAGNPVYSVEDDEQKKPKFEIGDDADSQGLWSHLKTSAASLVPKFPGSLGEATQYLTGAKGAQGLIEGITGMPAEYRRARATPQGQNPGMPMTPQESQAALDAAHKGITNPIPGPVYAGAAAAGRLIPGMSAERQEQAAEKGDTTGIVGENIVPVAATLGGAALGSETGQKAVGTAADKTLSAGLGAKNATGLALRTEKGTLRPSVATVGRTGGALLGTAAGHLTGIPGAAEVGGITGALGGRAAMDAIVPKRPFDVPTKGPLGASLPSSDEFYQNKAADLTKRGREQSILDKQAPSAGGEGITRSNPVEGVSVYPEPREPLPTDRPGAMWSVGREETLPESAQRGAPGAGDVLRNIGRPIIYEPREGVGYSGPRAEGVTAPLQPDPTAARAAQLEATNRRSITSSGEPPAGTPERRTFMKGVTTQYDQPTPGEQLAKEIRATRGGVSSTISEGEALQRIMHDPNMYEKYKLADDKTRGRMLIEAKSR